MQTLSELEAKEIVKQEYKFNPFEEETFSSERKIGGWIFYYPKIDSNDSLRVAYIVSDNHKVLDSYQIAAREVDDLFKKMLASTSQYANPEGMQLNSAYLGARDAGANLDSYDQSSETVQRVVHTLGLRENSKLGSIDEEYILKDKSTYINHVSDSYTLAIKTYDAYLDSVAAHENEQAGKYLVQLFTILEYIKLFRSDSAWSSQMAGKVDNMSLLYRYEDSITADLKGMAVIDNLSQVVDLTTLHTYKAFKSRFEQLNALYEATIEK